MKVAVTGATGFIGRHVLERLRGEPVAILALGRDRARWNGIGEFIACDLADPDAETWRRLGAADVLLHLAWDGLPNYRSLHHFERELPRQYAFLKRLVESGLPRLVVTGTCFEYGMQEGRLSETLPARPETPYGLAKDSLRRELEFLAAGRDLAFTWCRLFYLWGEGQAAGSLYRQLADAVAGGAASFDMSGGEQLRDYLPVAAVADYLVRLALRPHGGGIVNVCSGRPVSVRRLVEDWCAAHGWPIALNLGRYPYPDHEPMAFWGDATRLAALAGRDDGV